MKSAPKTSVRFDNKAQAERFAKAAKARRWSMNRFILEACEVAAKIPATGILSAQLMTKRDQPSLNQ